MGKKNYQEYFANRGAKPKGEVFQLLDELVVVGDALDHVRRKSANIDDVVSHFDKGNFGFSLKQTVGMFEADVGISPTYLRIRVGLSKKRGSVKPYASPKDTVKIVPDEVGHDVCIDAVTNYKDGDPNWAVCKSIKDDDGRIKAAAIYMPATREVFVSDRKKAYRIFVPRGPSEKPFVHHLSVEPLRVKFKAEVGSWHTKERALVKALFTTMVRENIGGSLHDNGMVEVSSAWVGAGVRGYSFIGNLNPSKGHIGAFIAERSGVDVVRAPITSDHEGREALFALHPDIAQDVLDYFYKAIKMSKGDVTIGAPLYVSNQDLKI